MKKRVLLPEVEPKYRKNDKPIFDRGASAETLKMVERRSAPAVSYQKKDYGPRPFRNLATGEIVLRYRRSKGFERVYEPWSPEGLVRRSPDYPRGWAAEEPVLGPPYVFKGVADLALRGADIRGINDPDIRGFAECALERVRRVAETVYSLGPKIDPEIPSVPFERELYWLEMEEAKRKRDAARGRVVTNDFKGDNREPGPVVSILRNGQVRMSGRAPWTRWHQGADGGVLHRGAVRIHGLKDYQSERKLTYKSGQRRKALCQQSPETNKPGRKPIGDRAMTTAERVAKHRANKRLKTPRPQGRHPPGIAAPTPHRPAVPGFNFDGDDMNTELLQLIYTRLGEVLTKLDHLKDTDYPLKGDEFRIVAGAASLLPERTRTH